MLPHGIFRSTHVDEYDTGHRNMIDGGQLLILLISFIFELPIR